MLDAATLAEVGVFADDELAAAHGFRTLMNGVVGMTDYLLKIIAIEGVSGGRALVSNPAIPLQLGFVYKEPLPACASRFIQYFRTDAAHKIINNNDSIPVDK